MSEIEREIDLLRPTLDAWARYFGERPELVREGRRCSVRFPPIPAPLAVNRLFFSSQREIFAREACSKYFRALGYDWSADGTIHTVPIPASFVAAARDAGVEIGFVPQLRRTFRPHFALAAWFASYTRGEVATNAAAQLAYRAWSLPMTLRFPHTMWCEQLAAFPHDASVHLLPLHAVPREEVERMGAKLRAAGGRVSRDRLAFYEEDLTRACTEIWRRIRAPEEFREAFVAARPQLDEHLARRAAAQPR